MLVVSPLVAQSGAARDSVPAGGGASPGGSTLDEGTFRDDRARRLLGRARVARLLQDSALRSYDAKAYQRVTFGLRVRGTGFERVLFRSENAARVRWAREGGVRIDRTGYRLDGAFLGPADGDPDADFAAIPYFPGREWLWIPTPEVERTRADVDARWFIHPFASGAERYYRFASGDSASIRLPDGTSIGLRELRITARRPDRRLLVGSFWFDTASAQLVRAAYRMTRPFDVWPLVAQLTRRDRDSLDRRLAEARDPEARAAANAELEALEEVPSWISGLVSPLHMTFDAITIEYALYNGRYWLPRANTASGGARLTFAQVPVRVEERFNYASVDGDLGLQALPPVDSIAERDVLLAAGLTRSLDEGDVSDTRLNHTREEIDRIASRADSLAQVAAAAGDTVGARLIRERAARRRIAQERVLAQCAVDSTFERVVVRFDGAMRYVTRSPCDTRTLRESSALPERFATDDPRLVEAPDRALLDALDGSLQPGWAPTWPSIATGLPLVRYNRVEALSVGVAATSELGQGLRARAVARIGLGDAILNGDVQLERTAGTQSMHVGVFRRLRAVNEEFGSPLSLGASLAALAYGRDEGFYFRSWGAELSTTRRSGGASNRGGTGQLTLRLFGERQRGVSDTAGVRNTWSLARAFRDSARFLANRGATPADLLGLELSAERTYGINPDGWRATTGIRLEGATGTLDYLRGMGDLGVTRRVGPVRLSATGMAGRAVGTVPLQRSFLVGGTRTVRGQVAGTQRGNEFWVTRAELSTATRVWRPVVFADAGWAGGQGRDLTTTAGVQRGVGAGLSILDGFLRVDLARGLAPRKQWRLDLYLDARL